MDAVITAIAWHLQVLFTRCLPTARIGKSCHPGTETFSTVASTQMASSLLTMPTWNMTSIHLGIAPPGFAMSPVVRCTVGETAPASVPNSTRTHCPPLSTLALVPQPESPLDTEQNFHPNIRKLCSFWIGVGERSTPST